MTDPKRQACPPPTEPEVKTEQSEMDEKAICNLLERASQNVKPLVDEERAGEVIGAELWNFRLQVTK